MNRIDDERGKKAARAAAASPSRVRRFVSQTSIQNAIPIERSSRKGASFLAGKTLR